MMIVTSVLVAAGSTVLPKCFFYAAKDHDTTTIKSMSEVPADWLTLVKDHKAF